MRFPITPHSDGWHTHLHRFRSSADSAGRPTPPERRGLHVLLAIALVGGLLTSGLLDIADDPRSLDVQASSAMRRAGDTLKQWQAQLSRGLQVSLRAVADGRDQPAAKPADGKGAASALVTAKAAP